MNPLIQIYGKDNTAQILIILKFWYKGSKSSRIIRIFTPSFNMFCDMIDKTHPLVP